MTLAAQMERIEEQKSALLSILSGWPAERLSYKPAQNEWSALEMLDHIVRVEVEILVAASRGLAKPCRIGHTDRLRTRFLENVFRSERRVKVPASAKHVLPESNLEWNAIVDRWNVSRTGLVSLLNVENPANLERGIFKHPVGGWMGMPQILEFFSVHLVHHGYQLERLQTSSASMQASHL